jgi:hypothetical protein
MNPPMHTSNGNNHSIQTKPILIHIQSVSHKETGLDMDGKKKEYYRSCVHRWFNQLYTYIKLPRSRARVLFICFGIAAFLILLLSLYYGLEYTFDLFHRTGDTCLRTPEQISDALYVLEQFDIASNLFDFEYWIEFGALLGMFHRGNYLPWDKDIDIGLTAKSRDMLMNNQTIRQYFLDRGLYVCRSALSIAPLWREGQWLTIDMNAWYEEEELDGSTLMKIQRKRDATAAMEQVLETYYDYPSEWLRPLARLPMGPLQLPVPKESEKFLRHHYPHSYWISLPYNPKCWWSLISRALPTGDTTHTSNKQTGNILRSSSSSISTSTSPPSSVISTPSQVSEVQSSYTPTSDMWAVLDRYHSSKSEIKSHCGSIKRVPIEGVTELAP